MAVTRRTFSVGGVLGRSFPIWGRNIFQLAILNAVIHSPVILHALLAAPAARDEASWNAFMVPQAIGRALFGSMATAAVIHGVFQQLQGQAVGLGACLRVCISRFFPVLGVILLVCLLIGAVAVPIGVVIGIGAPLLVTCGVMVVAVIAIVIVYSMYWVAVPVAVVERPGVVLSLSRSAKLARGSKWSIFVILLVVFVIPQFMNLMSKLMLGDQAMMAFWSELAIAIVFGALVAVANAVAYHDLRVAKEGVGIQDLVRVFE